ncbi:hypothetical protein PVK06_017373 [Gossypium arboreum]|uniref:Uncharacterized protein n=1 Tax=Gossypium arboreum TaxID=29729 RepID=A0ABR0Q3A3_GOSAR|nr:hypothetical protein PVK06_017373 [Gossypium arboreum]
MELLSLVEWWYNTSYHSTIQTTTYEAVYGQPPPIYLPYLPGESKLHAVDHSLQAREAATKMLKFYLCKAQNRMKSLSNKKQSERKFQVGKWVDIKLQSYRQHSVANRACMSFLVG